MLCTKMFFRAYIKAHMRFYTTFSTEKPLRRTIFYTCFFKTFDTEKLVHRECAHKFLQTDVFARKNFTRTVSTTQQNFFRTETFTHKKNMHNNLYRQMVFTQKVLRTEVLRTEGFKHNIFYIITDAFTHRCLYTDTNCTQKLVHTARVYTQPTFTQRGFASPSWSPTFRVPPFKFFWEVRIFVFGTSSVTRYHFWFQIEHRAADVRGPKLQILWWNWLSKTRLAFIKKTTHLCIFLPRCQSVRKCSGNEETGTPSNFLLSNKRSTW
jgi:hypothetical protein